MEEIDTNVGVISSFQQGIVYEERDKFSKSIFRRVYKRAYALAQEMVNLQLENEGLESYRQSSKNIITFVGRRGTGKSSAMLSFMQALLENGDEKVYPFTIKSKQPNEPVDFINIDWIDASLLEKGEDIFEVILAKMLNEFSKEFESETRENVDYEKRNLFDSFADIYKKHRNINTKSDISGHFSSEVAISNLRDLARSVDIREEFQNLVREYIGIKTSRRSFRQKKYRETFLVIAIDDIDMNIDSGFEILEKVQRYLNVNHLLILLSVNHEQMNACCEKHFVELYGVPLGSLSSQDNLNLARLKKRVKGISEQYLEKALPFYTRIYLPSLKKKDYNETKLLNEATQIEIQFEEGQKPKKYPMKQAIFILSEKKTMVRYDEKGIKRHFMEPDSLRELSDFWLFRETMKSLDENKDDFLESLDMNYRRAMDDLLFRYAEEKLPEDEREIFLRLSEIDFRRRSSEFLLTLIRNAEKNKELMSDEIKDCWKYYMEGYKEYGSSYGELLTCMYYFGRIGIGVFDKRLIHAILAMYSLNLTKLFYRCKKDKNDNAILKEILKGSVTGSWGRNLLPVLNKGTVKHYLGACKNVSLKSIKINFKPYDEKEDANNEDFRKDVEWSFIKLLFLSNFKNEENDKKEALESEQDNVKSNLTKGPEKSIVFTNGTAEYGVLNLVNNLFLYEESLTRCKKMIGEDNFKNIEKVYAKKNEGKKEEEYEKSLYEKIEEWKAKTGGFLIPIYSTDFYYNMLKRIVRETSIKNPIKEDEIWDALIALFDLIKTRLEESDAYYEKAEFGWKEIFENCPVIKRIREATTEEKKSLCEFIDSVNADNGTESEQKKMKDKKFHEE